VAWCGHLTSVNVGLRLATAAPAGTGLVHALTSSQLAYLRRLEEPELAQRLGGAISPVQTLGTVHRPAPDVSMINPPTSKQRLPPRLFILAVWAAHRAIYRASGGRRGLSDASADKWGTMFLTTVGRHSGKRRQAILGYIEDGPNLVTMAMNGWGDPDPAWWLNLQAHPDATVKLKDGQERSVRAHAASGDERVRLWQRWCEVGDDVDGYARRRSRETAIVVLEPAAAK
jgi:F420H(2)-dependent quinone reductase